jgi:hypothetical protein
MHNHYKLGEKYIINQTAILNNNTLIINQII